MKQIIFGRLNSLSSYRLTSSSPLFYRHLGFASITLNRPRRFHSSLDWLASNDPQKPHSFSEPHFGQSQDFNKQKRTEFENVHQPERRAKKQEEDKRAMESKDVEKEDEEREEREEEDSRKDGLHAHEHAVISTFDLFSIGIGPSSSHTVGPMRAGAIFINDLLDSKLLERVNRIKISLYGSLAATGDGHMTPSALLLGLEGADCETIETASVPVRFEEIKKNQRLIMGRDLIGVKGGKKVNFDYEKDLVWEWGVSLPLHSNGMRLTVFDQEGTMLATNDLYSVGGGFVINGAMSTASNPTKDEGNRIDAGIHQGEDEYAPSATELAEPTSNIPLTSPHHPPDLAENLFYKQIKRGDAAADRRAGAETRNSHRATVAGPHSLTEPGHELPKIPGSLGETMEDDRDALNVPEDLMELHKGMHDVEGASSGHTSTHKGATFAHASGMEEESEDDGSGEVQPPYPFRDAASLLVLCKQHNLTIAQLVYENERHWYSDEEIRTKLFKIWAVMDNCIREGVHSQETVLPGSLRLNRRAPALYKRLTRGLYPSQGLAAPSESPNLAAPNQPKLSDSSEAVFSKSNSSMEEEITATVASPKLKAGSHIAGNIPKKGPPRVHGRFDHPIFPTPSKRTTFPAIDYLTVYAIAVNEVNGAGGRVVTAPTNGAAGIIPSVLKYVVEFLSDDQEREVFTFLLTAAAIGMLYKRGATLSAAEGGCMAEVGVACSMAAGGFAACMGASPETILQAAEIGIEHNLGLTCDPIGGLVQAPCIERNALGSVKAVVSANLALASPPGSQRVSLDEAISAMRLTAKGMRNEFKETSLSGLATSVSTVQIPVSVPDC